MHDSTPHDLYGSEEQRLYYSNTLLHSCLKTREETNTVHLAVLSDTSQLCFAQLLWCSHVSLDREFAAVQENVAKKRVQVEGREGGMKQRVARSSRPHLQLCMMHLGSCSGHLVLQLSQLRFCCHAADLPCCILQAGQLPLQAIHCAGRQVHLWGQGGQGQWFLFCEHRGSPRHLWAPLLTKSLLVGAGRGKSFRNNPKTHICKEKGGQWRSWTPNSLGATMLCQKRLVLDSLAKKTCTKPNHKRMLKSFLFYL